MSELNDLTIGELRARKSNYSDGAGVSAEHIDEELAQREAERARERALLDTKIMLKQARKLGLEDDPAVVSLEEYVAELEADLYPSATTELAEAAGVDEADVAALSEAEAERALDLVDSIEQGRNSSHEALRQSAKENREELDALLEDASADVETAALAAPIEDGASVTADDLVGGE